MTAGQVVKTTLPDGDNIQYLRLGNFNKDGKIDIAFLSYNDINGSLQTLTGNGDGTFSLGQSYNAVATGHDLELGDFDGDGNIDIAIANQNPARAVFWLGDGLGNFKVAPWSPISTGTNTLSIAVADFNSDGLPDVALTNLSTNNVNILLNTPKQVATAQLTGVNVSPAGTHQATATYPDTPSTTPNFAGSSSNQVALQGTPIPTSTTLEINTSNTINAGQSVKLTAKVTIPSPPSGPPAIVGIVSFFDGATLLGTGTIASGVASINADGTTIAKFVTGTHTLTATYNDTRTTPLLGSSTSDPVALTVASISLSLGSSLNPSPYPQSVTFTVTVASAVTGTIQFFDGGVPLGSPISITAATSATYTALAGTLNVGTHVITAVYSGDPTHPSAPLDQLVTPATLTVTATSTSRFYGQPNPAFTYVISGFVNGETQGGTVTGAPALTSTASQLDNAGTYPIVVAIASLQATNYIFQPADGVLTVNRVTPGQNGTIAVTVSSSQNPSIWGVSVKLIAHLPANATGTVTFFDGVTSIGTALISGNQAILPITSLAAASHPITVSFPGDTNYNPATSAVLNQVVNPATLTVTADGQQRQYGAANPPLTATIMGFVNNDTAAVVSGAAALSTTATISSPVGSYPIAIALGTLAAMNYTFALIPGILTITPGPSITTLSATPANPMYGDQVVLTASVAPAEATGTVSFYEGTTLLGEASLDNTSHAVLPISTLVAGTHTITAVYSGDLNLLAGSSAPATVIVAMKQAPGGGAALTITVQNASRTFGAVNPQFEYIVTGALINPPDTTYGSAISGTPTFTTTATATSPAGTAYPISVSGLSSANYVIATVNGTLTIATIGTATTLAANPTSTQYGDPVTLTATVTPAGATGTVTFYDGSVFLGQGTVTSGVATFTTTYLNAAAHSITAEYNGDGNYGSSTSAPVTVTVAKKQGAGGGAALTITVQNTSRTYGTADPDFVHIVTGPLLNGDTYEGAVTGASVYTTTATTTSPVGTTYPISVSGLNSANYEIATVNGTLTIVAAGTTTTLAASPTSTQYGDPITLTATIAPSGSTATLTGTVAFMEGDTALGTGTAAGGLATLTIATLIVGPHTITATYLGDTNFSGSTSTPATLMVAKKQAPGGGPALTITVNNATRPAGQANPAFSYTVTGTLVNGDAYATAVTGVPLYATTATVTSSTGSYPISVSALNSANYVIAFVNGTLTVTPAEGSIILTVPPGTKSVGARQSY